jgi:DnaJ-domain-containing protein 1
MQFVLDIFKSTWRGAIWFITALVGATLMYSDAMHAIEESQAQGNRNRDELVELKSEIKADIKEIKQDIKTLLRESK